MTTAPSRTPHERQGDRFLRRRQRQPQLPREAASAQRNASVIAGGDAAIVTVNTGSTIVMDATAVLAANTGASESITTVTEVATTFAAGPQCPPPSAMAQKQRCDCVCCLERSSVFVSSTCGHLLCCGDCRRRLVFRELHSRNVFGLPKMRELPTSMLDATILACLVCRTEGTLVPTHKFQGKLFHT